MATNSSRPSPLPPLPLSHVYHRGYPIFFTKNIIFLIATLSIITSFYVTLHLRSKFPASSTMPASALPATRCELPPLGHPQYTSCRHKGPYNKHTPTAGVHCSRLSTIGRNWTNESNYIRLKQCRLHGDWMAAATILPLSCRSYRRSHLSSYEFHLSVSTSRSTQITGRCRGGGIT